MSCTIAAVISFYFILFDVVSADVDVFALDVMGNRGLGRRWCTQVSRCRGLGRQWCTQMSQCRSTKWSISNLLFQSNTNASYFPITIRR